jgi:hypothetical protein
MRGGSNSPYLRVQRQPACSLTPPPPRKVLLSDSKYVLCHYTHITVKEYYDILEGRENVVLIVCSWKDLFLGGSDQWPKTRRQPLTSNMSKEIILRIWEH